MNEFTKEELRLLRTCLTKQLHDVHYPLEDKLTLMIENYCEHLYTEGSGNHIVCARCHKSFGKR